MIRVHSQIHTGNILQLYIRFLNENPDRSFGEYFCNNFVGGDWRELRNEKKNPKALDKVLKYLFDNESTPQNVERNRKESERVFA